jgi:hypothetical protein
MPAAIISPTKVIPAPPLRLKYTAEAASCYDDQPILDCKDTNIIGNIEELSKKKRFATKISG